ncbi:hypothetical protein AB3S75_017453 [Citrus x aurantiifolia]
MAIGEIFLTAFLKVLFDRLMSREVVLSDAQEKQLTERAVKMWLDELRDLAYDVEDVLDEFTTEVRRNL